MLRKDLREHVEAGRTLQQVQPGAQFDPRECPTPRDDSRDDDDWQFVVRFRGHDYLVSVDPYIPDPRDEDESPEDAGGTPHNSWPGDVAARDTF